MTVDQTLDAIKIMQAYAEGKQIQVQITALGQDEWHNIDGSSGFTPQWAWDMVEYRVAPPLD